MIIISSLIRKPQSQLATCNRPPPPPTSATSAWQVSLTLAGDFMTMTMTMTMTLNMTMTTTQLPAATCGDRRQTSRHQQSLQVLTPFCYLPVLCRSCNYYSENCRNWYEMKYNAILILILLLIIIIIIIIIRAQKTLSMHGLPSMNVPPPPNRLSHPLLKFIFTSQKKSPSSQIYLHNSPKWIL